MSDYILPPVSSLNLLSKDEQTALLNNLFEPHPTIINLLLPLFNNNKFESYTQLIETIRIKLLTLSPEDPLTHDIISSHPRLGVPRGTTKLSKHSQQEQANLQKNETNETVKKFIELNELYERTFPGLKFILFVNGRSKDAIVQKFNERLSRNSYVLEVKDALNAMCDIALDRIKKLNSHL